MSTDETVFFEETLKWIGKAEEILELKEKDELASLSGGELKQRLDVLWKDASEPWYEESYLNPEVMHNIFPENWARTLCFLRSELNIMIAYAYEGEREPFSRLKELFIKVREIYGEEGRDAEKALDEIRKYFFDTCGASCERYVRGITDPEMTFFLDLINEAQAGGTSYLYRYGNPIGENERKTAQFLQTLSEEEIQRMADVFTEGYRLGFENTGKDLSIKKTVQVEFMIGFERMIGKALLNFEKLGLRPVFHRQALNSMWGLGTEPRGVFSLDLSRQYAFDHRNDQALYLDRDFMELRVKELEKAFRKYEKEGKLVGGPACVEIFGEENFLPKSKPGVPVFTDEQNALKVEYQSKAGKLTNQFIPGEERSFTIIAYPVPALGEDYEEIFRETVKINTLDYIKYRDIQQKLTDALDRCEYVKVKGRGANHTEMRVQLITLQDPSGETKFENCVADVNIPVGEVFTSPVLKGTEGTLHVPEVFLVGNRFLELEIKFKDGLITEYNCSNFDTEKENKNYIYENILMRHDTLPVGEFAIGTNTAAYAMARRFKIQDRLPILIAEKTGPHFAVGDTCYSYDEDIVTRNPDGKKIVARDNEISIRRKEDTSKAYFHCHTDITIPYDELEYITGFTPEGEAIDFIRDGLFALPGTEELNQELS